MIKPEGARWWACARYHGNATWDKGAAYYAEYPAADPPSAGHKPSAGLTRLYFHSILIYSALKYVQNNKYLVGLQITKFLY